jgi:hypothetical protein
MPGPARTLAASLNDGDSLRIDMLWIGWKSFSLILPGAGPCIRLGLKGNRPGRAEPAPEGHSAS